ncbi:ECF transporter S component [Clostridium sp. YIM B02505]|uniref:ECF transporter S component n=1 Tax=Clostridium yunnanense TaxID=2800325 RepID=A0ABS1EX70_9CLOT|nr:ECF transporter S component [Clostridium yunnanense]MBK1813905.1 ECF transporter S component [Clostridium yunnanense]
MENSKNLKVKDLALTGLMIALVFIAGNIIKIPTAGGFVHLGDCMVLLSPVVLGKKRGALAAALGMAMVDISGGWLIWAPFTFVIKAGMAYIAGVVIEKFKSTYVSYIVGFILAAIFMIFGYFLAGIVIAAATSGNGFSTAIVGGIALAAKDVVGNILQATAGVVIALPLSAALVKKRSSASI